MELGTGLLLTNSHWLIHEKEKGVILKPAQPQLMIIVKEAVTHSLWQ